MRILIGTNSLVTGSGIDRVVMLQAEDLMRQGHEVRVLCFEIERGLKTSFEVVEFPRCQSVSLERIRRLYPFFGLRTRRQLQAQIAWCEQVYAEQYPWSVIGWWAKKKGKHFIQINHGIADPNTFQHLSHQWYIWCINRLAFRFGKRADEVWSVSDMLAKEWTKKTGQASAVYRPQGEWMTAITQRTPDTARQVLAQKNRYLLFVGRISPHKGIHLLLEVMVKLQKTIPDLELKVIGKLADQGYLDQLRLRQVPGVSFLGVVSDEELGMWYQGCSVYVTATQWEGWDLPVAEALFFERPVVCFDVSAHKEFSNPLVHLVPLNSVSDFAEVCQQLLTAKQ